MIQIAARVVLFTCLAATIVVSLTQHGRRIPAKTFDARHPISLVLIEAALITLAIL